MGLLRTCTVGSWWLCCCTAVLQAILSKAGLWQALFLLILMELHAGGWMDGWVGDATSALGGFEKLLV